MLGNFLILTIVVLLAGIPVYMSAQYDYHKARHKMVNIQIKARGIKDKRVLESMYKVPRHLFVPKMSRALSYKDQALSIGYNQTISQPYVVAFTLASLLLDKDDNILEIGTGSGYLAAVLAEIVDSVVTMEIVEPLGLRSSALLDSMGYSNLKVIVGDGFHGFAEAAPYDAIIVSAGAEEVPAPLLDQLKVGGKLIMPVGPKDKVQKLTIFTKHNSNISKKVLTPVRFVPLTRNRKK